MMEINTVFLHVRSILKMGRKCESSFYRINAWINLVTLVFFRVIVSHRISYLKFNRCLVNNKVAIQIGVRAYPNINIARWEKPLYFLFQVGFYFLYVLQLHKKNQAIWEYWICSIGVTLTTVMNFTLLYRSYAFDKKFILQKSS